MLNRISLTGAPSYPAATSAPQDPTPSTSLTQSQANKLKAAREKYEPKLSVDLAKRHCQNQERVAQAITECLSGKLATVHANDIPQKLGENLMEILNKAKFDPLAYVPKDPKHIHGYGKYLLYVNEKDGKTEKSFCLQIFAFDKEQKTVIHDHPCECSSLVYDGKLRERFYEINNEGEAVKVKTTQKNDRERGNLGTLKPDVPNAHSLKNKSKEHPALSVHLYLMDGIDQPAAVQDIYIEKKKSPVNNPSTMQRLAATMKRLMTCSTSLRRN